MMNQKDPKLIVLSFNESINNQDIEGLSKFMAPNYKFIDSGDEVYDGKDLNVKGWIEFFKQFPDYLNHFPILESRGKRVFVTGYSTCSDERLDGPAIWVVKVENNLIEEWRIYSDTLKNRERLGIQLLK